MNLKSTSRFNLPLFKNRPCSREKVLRNVPFERTLDHTHSFTNGKVSSHNTRNVSLSAMSSETHLVVRLFTAVSSSYKHS